ncbi:MAG: HAD-IC family P-type ATPase, partial [Dehalococcoidia bacterium]|nr:HAD-IC family P-type ATPase [Dehalococcoidia bacterium]
VDVMASQGMRVLALAEKRVAHPVAELSEREVASGFTLVGLQGMIDPPRPEAIAAVHTCHEAGITVKMITGDHRATAAAIGRQLGLLRADQEAISGVDLSRLSDDEIIAASQQTNVFARVAPEHKLRLVRALQAQGHVVAMTGDGVNDAPALKQADIGIAMGITGTAVSKESADIVLTDDNFASIAAAVEEGRRVYDNLIKSLAFILPTNIGLALILLVAVAFFPFAAPGEPLLPMLPTQILWINLVGAVALALPLAFEAMEPNVMRRPPRDPNAPIMSGFVVFRTVVVAVLMAAAAIGLFLWQFAYDVGVGRDPTLALREAQTMAVTTVILFQVFYVINCRSLTDSLLRIGLFTNPTIYVGIGTILLLQAAFIYLPPMNTLFSSLPLSWYSLALSAGIAFLIVPIISIEKAIVRRARAA